MSSTQGLLSTERSSPNSPVLEVCDGRQRLLVDIDEERCARKRAIRLDNFQEAGEAALAVVLRSYLVGCPICKCQGRRVGVYDRHCERHTLRTA